LYIIYTSPIFHTWSIGKRTPSSKVPVRWGHVTPPKFNIVPEKWMVERPVSFWDGMMLQGGELLGR